MNSSTITPEQARHRAGRGWKFLDPTGCTYWDGAEFQYPLPRPGEKWGPWITAPKTADYDGDDCGHGRLHIMNRLDARYAPSNWWPWFAEWRGLVGRSNEKTGASAVRLRRVSPRVFARIIRLGWCAGAVVRDANLRGADLSDADLRDANHCNHTVWPAGFDAVAATGKEAVND